jgi:hypothetical protein
MYRINQKATYLKLGDKLRSTLFEKIMFHISRLPFYEESCHITLDVEINKKN